VENPAGSITRLLQDWMQGNSEAKDKLFKALYDELRRRAAHQLKGERHGHTLSPSALVHEAYVRLAGRTEADWKNRTHFLAVASQVMRGVLVDHARARRARKRPDAHLRVTLEGIEAAPRASDCEILALNDALDQLQRFDPRQSQIVVLRYFGGLSVDETAQVLDISPATVKREWTVAKAWLHRQLKLKND